MAGRAPTLASLADRLVAEGLLTPDGRSALERHAAERPDEERGPWYLSVLVGCGAWVSAVFFAGFLGFFLGVVGLTREPPGLFLLGATAIALGVVFQGRPQETFRNQAMAAVVVGGHLAALLAVGQWSQSVLCVAAAALLLSLTVHRYLWLSALRFLSVLSVPAAATAWLLSENLMHGLHAVTAAVTLLAVHLLTTGPCPPRRRAGALGLAAAAPAMILLLWGGRAQLSTPLWPSAFVMALALVWLHGFLSPPGPAREPARQAAVALAAALFGAVTTPGLVVALVLLALGFARRDAPLTALGLLFFPVFLWTFYYDLNVTLLAKSLVLVASGAVLLCARWGLR